MTTHALDVGARSQAWRWLMWGGAALLLLAPRVAMRFTDEVQWDQTDFIVFGTMLATACVAGEVVARTVRTRVGRAIAGGAIGLAFLLVWAELAVGILGRW